MPEPKGPQAPVKPDPQMESLLREAFASFGTEFGYAVDEVAITIPRERIVEACRLAKDDARLRFDYLRCLAVTEYADRFQAAYMLYSTKHGHKCMFRVNAPKDAPSIPSVTSVWRGADWHEREGAELFGVTFSGHPQPQHLLLFDEFKGKYPLRKDYPFEETQEWSPETHPQWKRPEQ